MPEIVCSPEKRLHVTGADLESYPDLTAAFAKGSGEGLLLLDTAAGAYTEEPLFAYWKDFTRLYLSLFMSVPGIEQHDFQSSPCRVTLPDRTLEELLPGLPPMKGAEYCDSECLLGLWQDLEAAFHGEIVKSRKKLPDFLAARHSGWSLLGRVCFHLAENKSSPDTPFAFLATFVHRVSEQGTSRHLPLGRALEEFGGARDKGKLIRLLSPVHKAARDSAFLKAMLASGDIYHPVTLTPSEAYRFLSDIPVFNKSGIHVRVPDWWRPKQPRRPQIEVRLGDREPGQLGLGALLDFQLSVVIGEQVLTDEDVKDLLKRTENLVFFKGQWVVVDPGKLKDLLSGWKGLAKGAGHLIPFSEGLRLMAGIENFGHGREAVIQAVHTRVVSGKWLEQVLGRIRSPETGREIERILETHLKTALRPYQKTGVAWLHVLSRMRLGALLADDMGLGKTVQVLALLLIRKHAGLSSLPALLIVPASLLGNWKSEMDRFAPSLKYRIAHASGDGLGKEVAAGSDVLMTTYGAAVRTAWLSRRDWDVIILDEAQAIKNPGTRQTRAVKAFQGEVRVALTGTPVENRLADLWSIFDFLSPGLLGTADEFAAFTRRGSSGASSPYAALRELIRPYVLRRLKTDRNVISDLPEKTEFKTWCSLSKEQAVLYQETVRSLARAIEKTSGVQRRGIIFAYLMRFKQICNHPAHFLKDGVFAPEQSGKFARLKEIAELIGEKQEKVLVFTQFQEMTGPLSVFLEGIFGKKGLVLHGKTGIRERAARVAAFQSENGPSFFVLSLKAGGTGLNLTAASHVVHFDRWWNPAVENQATDRAFRIGQKSHVLVHKFVCKGTLEEKIDALIASKQNMARELLDEAAGALLTEMSNDELLKVVALDITSATGED